jgi:hypothetical protein
MSRDTDQGKSFQERADAVFLRWLHATLIFEAIAVMAYLHQDFPPTRWLLFAAASIYLFFSYRKIKHWEALSRAAAVEQREIKRALH